MGDRRKEEQQDVPMCGKMLFICCLFVKDFPLQCETFRLRDATSGSSEGILILEQSRHPLHDADFLFGVAIDSVLLPVGDSGPHSERDKPNRHARTM